MIAAGLGTAAALAGAATLPSWLPQRVIALRGAIFALVNGEEGMSVLDRPGGPEEFVRVYGDPAANGRSHGAGLSDLFWYWLAPGPEVHQEHLEPGPRYDQAARTTRTILASRSKDEWADLVTRCTARVLDELPGKPAGRPVPGQRIQQVRLRDLMMPIWAEAYYEVVFGEPCPRFVRDLIVGNADDVVSALKCTSLRHMKRRDRLTRYLRARIDAGQVGFDLPSLMTPQEQACYLQGAFFNTAIVQMSEAMAHLLLAVAEHEEVQERLQREPSDDDYLSDVINETLRVWPLFGIAHRIVTADIDVDPPITAGTVLLFDYPGFHHTGRPALSDPALSDPALSDPALSDPALSDPALSDPTQFDPDRWRQRHGRPPHHIPFGVSANRPCPARGIAPPGMRAATREVLRRYTLSSSAAHTRSLPNRGPVLLTRRSEPAPTPARLRQLRWADRWQDVPRSLTQLAFGTIMVLDARRLALARTYFAEHPEQVPASSRPTEEAV
ncbi:cytochrome P450 [Microlunatus endophyticus]|uniref:Cytochrome P450 n=2 Tax=Microlunatus endophyticus TaxID=1716077 RepID=A0A917S5W3_9ACTN|nr:cytochrome P450 [Microlunatus endophyticus]